MSLLTEIPVILENDSNDFEKKISKIVYFCVNYNIEFICSQYNILGILAVHVIFTCIKQTFN